MKVTTFRGAVVSVARFSEGAVVLHHGAPPQGEPEPAHVVGFVAGPNGLRVVIRKQVTGLPLQVEFSSVQVL